MVSDKCTMFSSSSSLMAFSNPTVVIGTKHTFIHRPSSISSRTSVQSHHRIIPRASTSDAPRPMISRRQFANLLFSASAFSALQAISNPTPSHAARPEGVNRPELLPTEFTTVIDLEKFLATGEVRRLRQKIEDLEQRTGYKVRLLTQRFPQTPGLAVRDYWKVDDNTVVCVADFFGGTGQLLKFNVGSNVDRLLPPRFWSILSATYGNKFYVTKNGEAASIINAVDSIRYCLLQGGCATPPKDLQTVIF